MAIQITITAETPVEAVGDAQALHTKVKKVMPEGARVTLRYEEQEASETDSAEIQG